MSKDFNIHTTYEGQRRIIECPQREFLNKAAEYFKLDVSNIELYAIGKQGRKKITPYEIVDLMHVEIICKSSRMDGQRNLRSYFTVDSPLTQNFVDKIITKLSNNTPLNGTERRQIINWLQEYSKDSRSSGVKRKLNDDDDHHPPPPPKLSDHLKPSVSHKKIQVCTSNTKDSFAQTDIVNLTPAEASLKKDQALIKLKRLAQNGTNKEEIALLMKETFEDRRNFILVHIPPVPAIKDKFPGLFCVDEVKNELDRIFYPGKCIEFMCNMEKYSTFIVSECARLDLYDRTKLSMERAHTLQQRKYAEVVGSVLMLPLLLDECLDFINLRDNYHESDVYPFIDASTHAIKEIFFDQVLFKVLVEGLLLCEASNFKEAILCLVAGYYIFNVEYPESCSQTLIVFEKMYLESNESTNISDRTGELIKKLKLQASDLK